MNKMNFFFPYQNAENHHENVLSRAFFVVLKYSPIAQQMFIDLIREKQFGFDRQNILPSYAVEGYDFDIQSQTSSIRNDDGILLSVLITSDDVCFTDPVMSVERDAIYDGVISLGDSITLIVEVKLHKGTEWREQLNPSKKSLENGDVKPVGSPLCVTWKEIFQRLHVVVRKGGMSHSERMMMDDFFQLVDHDASFTYLKPYTSIGVCYGDKGLLDKRCRNILEELGVVRYHSGWKHYLEFSGSCRMAALSARCGDSTDEIVLEVHPGANINQARAFFEGIDEAKLLSLCESQGGSWKLAPNFHFADTYKQFFWTETGLEMNAYLAYWKKNIREAKQYDRQAFVSVLDYYHNNNMITLNDFNLLSNSLLNSGRNVLRIIPGISMRRVWTLDEAVKLDVGTGFSKIVRDELQNALASWNQSFEDTIKKNEEPV